MAVTRILFRTKLIETWTAFNSLTVDAMLLRLLAGSTGSAEVARKKLAELQARLDALGECTESMLALCIMHCAMRSLESCLKLIVKPLQERYIGLQKNVTVNRAVLGSISVFRDDL